MVHKIVLTITTFAVFGLAPTADVFGDQWYPFYGYRRPNYLGRARVATAPPSVPQAYSACPPPTQNSTVAQSAPVSNWPNVTPASVQISPAEPLPSQETVVPAQPSGVRSWSTGGWYPFYGNRRPSYLDR
jgi:hypothetical protein